MRFMIRYSLFWRGMAKVDNLKIFAVCPNEKNCWKFGRKPTTSSTFLMYVAKRLRQKNKISESFSCMSTTEGRRDIVQSSYPPKRANWILNCPLVNFYKSRSGTNLICLPLKIYGTDFVNIHQSYRKQVFCI